jgi:hypothetical protein
MVSVVATSREKPSSSGSGVSWRAPPCSRRHVVGDAGRVRQIAPSWPPVSPKQSADARPIQLSRLLAGGAEQVAAKRHLPGCPWSCVVRWMWMSTGHQRNLRSCCPPPLPSSIGLDCVADGVIHMAAGGVRRLASAHARIIAISYWASNALHGCPCALVRVRERALQVYSRCARLRLRTTVRSRRRPRRRASSRSRLPSSI